MEQLEKPEKKTGGRPKKDDAEKRLRPGWGFTPAEIKEINGQFDLSGEQYIGAFIYKKVMNQALSNPKAVYFPEDLRTDFSRLSNNINQIAMVLNSKKTEPLATEMLQKLELISRQYAFLVQRLSNQ